MKVVFPIIVASSGSDVYYNRLRDGLHKKGVQAEIFPLDYRYEFIPFIHRRLHKKLSSFDIIHSNGDYGSLFKVPGKPLVITLHHNVLDSFYQNYTTIPQKIYHFTLLKKRFKKSIEAADATICVSHASRKSFQVTFPGHVEKLLTIYNGIDLELFKPLPEKYPTKKGALLFVGNLSKRKGVDLLNPIMEKLGKGFELLCITMANLKVDLKRDIKTVSNINPLQLAEFYNRAEMLLFPSRLEGFGYAVVEAMACAKPVVCANRSSLPELIDNGLGGFLCDTGNVDCFVKNIRVISGSIELAKKMGQYNRTKVEKMFDINQMVENYIALYQWVLKKEKGKPFFR